MRSNSIAGVVRSAALVGSARRRTAAKEAAPDPANGQGRSWAAFGGEGWSGLARSFRRVGGLVLVLGLVWLVLPAVGLSASRAHGSALARPAGGRVLVVGSGYSGRAVARLVRGLQRALVRAGDRPGPVDGLFGPLTEAAVVRFQSAHGLPVDGIAGPRTLGLLGARPARQPARAGQHPVSAGQRPASAKQRPASAGQRPAQAGQRSVPAGSGVAGSSRGGDRSSGSSWASRAWLWLVVALALVLLASVFWRARRPGAAVALVTEPENPSVNGAGVDAGRAEQEEQAAVGSDRAAGGDDDPAAAFDLGLGLEQQGDLAGARAAYKRAMQAGHPAAACNLGVLLGAHGDLAGAEAAFRLADHHGDPAGAFNLGLLLEDHGDLDGARSSFRRAVALGPSEVAELAHAALSELDQASPAPPPGGAREKT